MLWYKVLLIYLWLINSLYEFLIHYNEIAVINSIHNKSNMIVKTSNVKIVIGNLMMWQKKKKKKSFKMKIIDSP